MTERDKARLALLTVLVEQAPGAQIGRTALMKYMYFLQTLRGVPLGYNFTMYAYGPFDSDVLSDLSSAESMGFVTSTTVMFSGGYGYRIQPGASAHSAKKHGAKFLDTYANDVNWLFDNFGDLNSAELELTSTIVYVDREITERGEACTIDEVARLVHEVKSHFAMGDIRRRVEDLLTRRVLKSTVEEARRA